MIDLDRAGSAGGRGGEWIAPRQGGVQRRGIRAARRIAFVPAAT
jgi:hypothetical protein